MRLFLSSYRAGKFPDEMIRFFGQGSRIGVITNAKDYKYPKQRAERVNNLLDFFKILGFKPQEIDLRVYFDNQQAVIKEIQKYPVVWMAGGNTFLLRRAIRQAGIESELKQMIETGKLTYGGESAGAILPGPTLKGAEDKRTREDNPDYVPKIYDKEVIWEGLNLINFEPVPHFKNEFYGPLIDRYIKVLEKNGLKYLTLREDQVLIIDGRKQRVLK